MTPVSHKHEEIKHAVEKLFATKPDWMKFYREVMGLQGWFAGHSPPWRRWPNSSRPRPIARFIAW